MPGSDRRKLIKNERVRGMAVGGQGVTNGGASVRLLFHRQLTVAKIVCSGLHEINCSQLIIKSKCMKEEWAYHLRTLSIICGQSRIRQGNSVC